MRNIKGICSTDMHKLSTWISIDSQNCLIFPVSYTQTSFDTAAPTMGNNTALFHNYSNVDMTMAGMNGTQNMCDSVRCRK